MLVFIRTDSSLTIGSGHLVRCLTLATRLRQRRAEVYFLMKEHPGNLGFLVQEARFPIRWLPLEAPLSSTASDSDSWLGGSWQDDGDKSAAAMRQILPPTQKADLLVVDHYHLDSRWEKRMRQVAESIMVIDDLADRHHDCDLLLDQNLWPDPVQRYEGLVPEKCRLLLGPHYALLKSVFYQKKQHLRWRNGQIRRVMVFMGGTDPHNYTQQALDILDSPEFDFDVDVVIGASNPHRDSIEAWISSRSCYTIHVQLPHLADVMEKADLSIGAGGSTSWERGLLALPSVTWVLADNQKELSQVLDQAGWIWLGTPESLQDDLKRLIKQPELLTKQQALLKEYFRTTEEATLSDAIWEYFRQREGN